VRCYFRSAAVKAMALLTLPEFPRAWQRRFCAALLSEDRWWEGKATAKGSAARGNSFSGF
jgi:hypothetical protein